MWINEILPVFSVRIIRHRGMLGTPFQKFANGSKYWRSFLSRVHGRDILVGVAERANPRANTKIKPMPEFQSEDAEREFWATHDSTEFIDWRSAGRRTFPNLKPTLRTISLRLPVYMIEDLKVLANKRDVPYQSLLKVFLAERLEKERRRAVAAKRRLTS